MSWLSMHCYVHVCMLCVFSLIHKYILQIPPCLPIHFWMYSIVILTKFSRPLTRFCMYSVHSVLLQFRYSYKIVSNSCWQSWGGDTSTSPPLTPKPPNPLRATSRRQTPPLPPSPSVAWAPSSCVNSSFFYLLQVRSWIINVSTPLLFSVLFEPGVVMTFGDTQTRPKHSTKIYLWKKNGRPTPYFHFPFYHRQVI